MKVTSGLVFLVLCVILYVYHKHEIVVRKHHVSNSHATGSQREDAWTTIYSPNNDSWNEAISLHRQKQSLWLKDVLTDAPEKTSAMMSHVNEGDSQVYKASVPETVFRNSIPVSSSTAEQQASGSMKPHQSLHEDKHNDTHAAWSHHIPSHLFLRHTQGIIPGSRTPPHVAVNYLE